MPRFTRPIMRPLLFAVIALGMSATDIYAQEIELPDSEVEKKKTADSDLDLLEEVEVEKLVIEALKSETTVQEAPAIITVYTAKDLRDMGHRVIGDAIQDIPSMLQHWPYGQTGQGFINRGIQMGALALHNTVDVFDIAGGGSLPLGEDKPIETVRSIEMISGPGGVLWGINSFVGVINIVSKTADDLDGVEASAGWGSGRGKPDTFKTYVMGGQKWWDNKIKLFAHASFETWKHGRLEYPFSNLIRATAPNPLGPTFRAGPTTHDPLQSWMFVSDGNVQLGDLAVYWHVPWGVQNRPTSWGGNVAHLNLGEDGIDCTNPDNKNACLNRVDPQRISRYVRWRVWEDYVMARYRANALEDKLRVEARTYWIYYGRNMVKYASLPPSSLLIDGVSVDQAYEGHRVAFNVDADAVLPRNNRLLFGGEVFYDYMPLGIANFHTRDATLDRLPFRPACPPDTADRRCPISINYETDRISAGIFANWQSRLHRTLMLDAGARLQTAEWGSHPHEALGLFSGAAVWTFMPDWNLKVNYAEGFRPPAFARINSNGEGITYTGNPDLRSERSRALQGEINARLFRGYRNVRHLNFRVNYGYTWILDSVAVLAGMNQNTSDRGIHSVETLADLRMKRGHWIGLSYTFLEQVDSLSGMVRTMPNQWINLRGLFNLWNRQLFLSSNLTVLSSLENASKHAPLSAGMAFLGNVDENGIPITEPVRRTDVSDLTWDRIRPFPLWNAGLRLVLPKQNLRFDADFYNLLDADGHYPVGDFDLTAYLNAVPNPRQGLSFFLRGQYTY